MTFRKSWSGFALLTIIALATAACAPLPPPIAQGPGSAAEDESITGEQGLAGREWALATLDGEDVTQYPARITAQFAQGQITGSSGCNSYFASYQTRDDALQVGSAGMTQMACAEDVMGREQAYLAALSGARSFSVQGGVLEIVHEGGVLAFTAVQPPEARPLAGALWRLTALNAGVAVQSLLAGSEITARFEEGQVSGSAGCNEFFAQYEVDGDALRIGPVARTKKMCEEGLMGQEEAFMAALQAAQSFQITGDQLEIVHEGGTLIFQAQ